MKVILFWSNITDGNKDIFMLEGGDAHIAIKAHGLVVGLDENSNLSELCELLAHKTALDWETPLALDGEYQLVHVGYVL